MNQRRRKQSKEQYRTLQTAATLGLFALPPVLFWFQEGAQTSAVIAAFAAVMAQSMVAFAYPGAKGQPMYQLVFLFSYIFLGFLPMAQQAYRVSYWGARQYSSNEYVVAASLIFLANTVFFITYIVRRNIRARRARNTWGAERSILKNRVLASNIPAVRQWIILGVLLINCVAVFIFSGANISAMVFRTFAGVSFNDRVSSPESPFTILSFGVLRYTPLLALVYFLFYFRVKQHRVFCTALCFAACFCALPTAIPRFAAAALYLPIMLLIFPRLLLGMSLPVIIVFGLFFVFPFLNQFRSSETQQSLFVSSNFDWVFDGHFDSFQSILMALDLNTLSMGKQLLGAVLFFVPRFLWPSKPIGTGAQLAQDNGLLWSNISTNFYAEGFVNFGILGVIAFAVLLALYAQVIDDLLRDTGGWAISRRPVGMLSARLALPPFLLVCLGHIFILLRGDLVTGLSSAASFLLPLIIANYLFRPRF